MFAQLAVGHTVITVPHIPTESWTKQSQELKCGEGKKKNKERERPAWSPLGLNTNFQGQNCIPLPGLLLHFKNLHLPNVKGMDSLTAAARTYKALTANI